MEMYQLIKPAGTATYVFLLATVLTGFLKFKFHVKFVKVQWHIGLGICTAILATIHAGLIWYIHR